MEPLDILDDKGNKTGQVKSYDEAHQVGLIHGAVHVWIINSKNELLVQKREKNKRAYPLHWDISAAGHISAGETSLEAAHKETKEELGLDIAESKFEYLFTLEEHIVLNNGTYVNNEFQDVYLVREDVEDSQIKLTDGEVEAVKFLSLDEFGQWMTGKGELVVPHEEEYRRLLQYLGSHATRKTENVVNP